MGMLRSATGAKWPPAAERASTGVDCDYSFGNSVEYMRRANEETFLVLQIEDQEAVDSVEEIAAVEGVDLLFVGPAGGTSWP